MAFKTRPYLNPYVGGALLGVLLFASFSITGGGLGASAALNRVIVAAVDGVAPQHVDRVGYMAEMAGGARCALQHSTLWMLIGTLLGGALSGFFHGRLGVATNRGPRIGPGARL
ncbi:MAG: hypothetical protein MUF51_11470, partial [Vicinamibacteria bacterium]|nr:hypothetical protein [Vicinamibacteria bacterium]